jgi:hypothetical protein
MVILQLWQIPPTLEPRFKEFPVNETFHGEPAAVVFERAEERRFRTVIRLSSGDAERNVSKQRSWTRRQGESINRR